MSETAAKRKLIPAVWFRLCPIRHVICLSGLSVIAAYFALRSNSAIMNAVSTKLVRPWHRFFSGIFDPPPFSAAEALIVAAVLFGIVYIIFSVVNIIRKPGRLVAIYRLLLSCLTAFSLIYGGFCLLWGAYYYSPDFEDQSGLHAQAISVEQLETVTRYFTDLVNEYSPLVSRDESGLFAEDRDEIFQRAPQLYAQAEEVFPCLAGEERCPKPFFFSRIMSYINFTGFFFPFTGEANINIDSPACLMPSTIAHELAHQRGVAAEDEANFVAVMACMENGDPVYCYSAALMAYIYLGNALHKADYDAWAENYERLAPEVRLDLQSNNAYWEQFETPVSQVSDTVYTGFLQSYGQELGLQTYGACVDLLVAYYYDIAAMR